MQKLDEVYGEQYQQDSVSTQACEAYAEIASLLVEFFNPRDAMDVGSGGGALVRGLQALNVNAVGLEGSTHATRLMPQYLYHWDLRRRLHTNVPPYDLVTCFDVAEHIEEEFADVLSKNLRQLMHDKSILVFGAAPEGQDGLGHVNCQHPCYWIDKLFPLTLNPSTSEELRRRIKQQPHTDFAWWVAKNLMVFTA